MPVAERRQLTVLFCDIVDSTTLADKLDPEDYHDVIRRFQRACTGVIDKHEGKVAQYLGDGLLVYFGFPRAHEDDAVRAVRASLGIVQAIQALHLPNAPTIQVRIGIHTGPVVAGEIGGGSKQETLALGPTPNIAARLQQLAEPQTILVTDNVYQLVQGFFVCESLGKRPIKGVTRDPQLYKVLSESGALSRFDLVLTRGLGPITGRDAELDLLRDRFELAKTGQPQVVMITGGAGIGKSRLLYGFRDTILKAERHFLIARCSQLHENTAFKPLAGLLKHGFRISDDDDPKTKLDKVRVGLEPFGLGKDAIPLFAAFLGLPGSEGIPKLQLSPKRQRELVQEHLNRIPQ